MSVAYKRVCVSCRTRWWRWISRKWSCRYGTRPDRSALEVSHMLTTEMLTVSGMAMTGSRVRHLAGLLSRQHTLPRRCLLTKMWFRSSGMWLSRTHIFWTRINWMEQSPWKANKYSLSLPKVSWFCGTRDFITVFTRSRHLDLFWARSIWTTPSHHIAWKPILISSHLLLDLPRCLSLAFLHQVPLCIIENFKLVALL